MADTEMAAVPQQLQMGASGNTANCTSSDLLPTRERDHSGPGIVVRISCDLSKCGARAPGPGGALSLLIFSKASRAPAQMRTPEIASVFPQKAEGAEVLRMELAAIAPEKPRCALDRNTCTLDQKY